jgi:hypothetical protein
MKATKKKSLPLTKEERWARAANKNRFKRGFSQLVSLEEFLNGEIDRDPILSFSNLPASALKMSSSEEGALRAELIQDLLPIADLSQNGSARFKQSEKLASAKRIEKHLRYLCKKINSLPELRPVFQVSPREPKINRRPQSRTQGVFSWGTGEWVVQFGLTFEPAFGQYYEGWAPRVALYGYIAAGLVTGELARLRRCGYCAKFFIAPEPRMTFCPYTDHGRLYYDRPSQRAKGK